MWNIIRKSRWVQNLYCRYYKVYPFRYDYAISLCNGSWWPSSCVAYLDDAYLDSERPGFNPNRGTKFLTHYDIGGICEF